jgi:hypothetical protein
MVIFMMFAEVAINASILKPLKPSDTLIVVFHCGQSLLTVCSCRTVTSFGRNFQHQKKDWKEECFFCPSPVIRVRSRLAVPEALFA